MITKKKTAEGICITPHFIEFLYSDKYLEFNETHLIFDNLRTNHQVIAKWYMRLNQQSAASSLVEHMCRT